jgi:hypothetical protein
MDPSQKETHTRFKLAPAGRMQGSPEICCSESHDSLL